MQKREKNGVKNYSQKLVHTQMLGKNWWKNIINIFKSELMLYISTSVWLLRTPNTDWNLNFQHFLCEIAQKMQKNNKFAGKFSQKNGFF